MKRIYRASASDMLGVRGSIPIRIQTLRPNPKYSIEEQLLLLYLLSLPPEWELKQDWVIRQYKGVMGRDKVKLAWAGLKDKGHLVKHRGTKFTDVYWVVYEIPLKDWNPVDQEPVDQELVDNNTDIKDTDKKETDITGTSILGKLELEQNPIEHIHLIEKMREDCAAILLKATSLESDLFSFDHESKFKKLEKAIGKDVFVKILPTLKDWIWAKNLFNKYSSTTRRG
jgi:hypothetical protein